MITIKLFEDTSAEQAKINCHLEESGGHADKSGLGPGVFNGPTPPPDTAKVLVNVFGSEHDMHPTQKLGKAS